VAETLFDHKLVGNHRPVKNSIKINVYNLLPVFNFKVPYFPGNGYAGIIEKIVYPALGSGCIFNMFLKCLIISYIQLLSTGFSACAFDFGNKP